MLALPAIVLTLASNFGQPLPSIQSTPGRDPDPGVGVSSPRDWWWVDIDLDGRADALTLDREGRPRLLRNRAVGGFIDDTERAGLGGIGRPRELSLVDWDGDGLPDLVVLDQQGLLSLHQNDGSGSFQDASLAAGLGGLRTELPGQRQSRRALPGH